MSNDFKKNPYLIEIMEKMQAFDEIGGVKDTAQYIEIMKYISG